MARKAKAPKAHREPRAPKAKQKFLEGMEPLSIAEIDLAADNFVAARNDWQARNQPMIEARNILEAAMKKHGLITYEYDSKIVQFVTDQKIKVNVKKAEKVDIPTSSNGDDKDDDDDD